MCLNAKPATKIIKRGLMYTSASLENMERGHITCKYRTNQLQVKKKSVLCIEDIKLTAIGAKDEEQSDCR